MRLVKESASTHNMAYLLLQCLLLLYTTAQATVVVVFVTVNRVRS